MRVIFTLLDTSLAGGVRVILEVASRLFEKGYMVNVVAMRGDHKWFHRYVPITYIKFPTPSWFKFIEFYAKFVKRTYFTSSAFFVQRFLKRVGLDVPLDYINILAESIPECDVSVASWYPTALAVWLSGKGRPYYHLQDFPAIVAENCDTLPVYCMKLFETTLKLPFHFLTVSTYLKDIVTSYQPSAKVKIVGVGVDTRVFYPRGSKVVDSKGKKTVMVIVRGEKYKGADMAIEVLNVLNREMPVHALMLSPSVKVMKKTFSSMRPEFTYDSFTAVNDNTLAKLYSSADAFLFTSHVEGFGLPPLEAMACGTPVVTTDCMGVRDYVVHDHNALIVPMDPYKIAKALAMVLKDEHISARLRKKGIETAEKWTWDKVVDKYEEAFREGAKADS
jgi:glycosyltransferase involved in cell wall biosynthesis